MTRDVGRAAVWQQTLATTLGDVDGAGTMVVNHLGLKLTQSREDALQ
jgi:hypothetical protein